MPRTAKQKAYDDEVKYWVNRLKRKAKGINKRGYIITEEINPAKPEKRLRSYIEALKERVENIYKYAKYRDPETMEIISGTERLHQERVKRSQKAAETVRENRRKEILSGVAVEPPKIDKYVYDDSPEYIQRLPQEVDNIMQEFWNKLLSWTPDTAWTKSLQDIKTEDVNMLKNIFNHAIDALGRETVAQNIKNNATYFNALTDKLMYQSGNPYKVFGIDSSRSGVQFALNEIQEIVMGRPLTVQESIEITESADRFNEMMG